LSDSKFLNNEEVASLTGKRQRACQAQVLRAMAIEHKIRPDGRVIVLRSHVEQMLGGKPDHGHADEMMPDWSAA
jgi:hypothetical protein